MPSARCSCKCSSPATGLASSANRKPDPAIFLYALNLIRVKAEGAMMIGDNLESDIEPARELGMKTLHVNHLDPAHSIRHALGAA